MTIGDPPPDFSLIMQYIQNLIFGILKYTLRSYFQFFENLLLISVLYKNFCFQMFSPENYLATNFSENVDVSKSKFEQVFFVY